MLPELVREGANGYKAVHYERLPLLMLQGIRELEAESATLRDQVTGQGDELQALREQDASLEARLAALERLARAGQAVVQAQR